MLSTWAILILSVTVVLLAAMLLFGRFVKKLIQLPIKIVDTIAAAATGLFQNKTIIHVTSNTLSITPITEIALARQTVREHVVYKRSWAGSEVVIVAAQEFYVKYGYTTHDVLTIVRRGGEIVAPKPQLLSLEMKEPVPTILWQTGGLYNRIVPADMLEISRLLDAQVRSDARIEEFKDILLQLIRHQLEGLQKQLDAPKWTWATERPELTTVSS